MPWATWQYWVMQGAACTVYFANYVNSLHVDSKNEWFQVFALCDVLLCIYTKSVKSLLSLRRNSCLIYIYLRLVICRSSLLVFYNVSRAWCECTVSISIPSDFMFSLFSLCSIVFRWIHWRGTGCDVQLWGTRLPSTSSWNRTQRWPPGRWVLTVYTHYWERDSVIRQIH